MSKNAVSPQPPGIPAKTGPQLANASTFLSTLKTYAGLIVAVGFVASIVVVTAAVAGTFAGKPDGKDEQNPAPPRRENPEFLVQNPDFAGTIELTEPSWSDDMADVDSEDFKAVASDMEFLMDRILEDSDISNVYNFTVVPFLNKTINGRVLVNFEIHLTNSSGLTEDKLKESVVGSYSVLLLTVLNKKLKAIDSHTLEIIFIETTTRPSATTLPAPLPVGNVSCGTSRMYSRPTGQSGRIIGGTPTEWYGVYPWVVMLRLNGAHLCGGTIWKEQHILTAAYCLAKLPRIGNTELVNTANLDIIAGKWLYGTDPNWHYSQVVKVAAAIVHEGYNSDNYANDIAMMKLEKPLNLNEVVQPVCRPDITTKLPPNGTVAGWGTTHEGDVTGAPPTTLTEVTLPLYDHGNCSGRFSSRGINRTLHDGTFCAGDGLRGACEGDSGGGLFAQIHQGGLQHDYDYTILGVVSNGEGCGRDGIPGLYTFVPHYLSWISDAMKTL